MTMAKDEEERVEFYEMGLDDRLLKAISLLGWSEPTLIQEKAIPLALEGHDILARARTGSGKTAVFAIPVIDKILKEHQKNPSDSHKTRAIIVVPSKELSKQIYTHVTQLTTCCSREIRIIDVASSEVSDLRPLLVAEPPDILVGTPSKLLAHIAAGTVKNLKSSVNYFVVDEADLLFSFGFEAEIQQLIERAIPDKGCQSYLVSATLNADVINLKNLVLHRPVVVRLDEPELPECEQLAQYHIKCEEEEKFVLINALMKLNLIRGRTIIFVRSLTRCYKLKIFLELFATKSCVLNPELPVSTRCNIVERFNTGIYDIIIACDEKCVHDPTERLKSKGAKKKLDRDYGISRGIDFQSVSNVINFDFPSSVTAYIHRVGRTARAINANNAAIEEGTVLSFISREEIRFFEKVQKSFEGKAIFKPYAFKMDELEAFRYRARDALRAVTKGVIHEARAKEIKQEIKNSERLKSFMTQNPTDAKILRHDKTLRNVRMQTHLKDIPDYIVPPTLLSRKRQITSVNAKSIDNEIEVTAPSSRKKMKKKKCKKVNVRSTKKISRGRSKKHSGRA